MAFFCIHCKSEVDPNFKACPFCGEPITEFLRRYLETPLDGKYQILSRLGIGGMGEVYKVLHLHLNAIRVIKLMRANIATDPAAHERFLREARLATKIHHPNVATLFDFSTLDETSRYMVWEYIEGINLHELIDQRGPLSPRYAARLAIEALLGLDAIHRAGIVHRDVSPENLMITRDDEAVERVKIIDLGIAKGSGGEDNNTKTGMFVGKWKYCSPEHLGMLPPGERIDGRADLYSFGIVFYEMLTGVPPFQADTPHAFLMMHASQRPRALRETNPGVSAPPELEALIFRALEKDRNQRFASAREFAHAIEQIAPALSDEAGAPPPLPATAELTDEATRIAARERSDAATVISVAGHAPTVAGEHPFARDQQPGRDQQPAVQRTLNRVPPAEEAQEAAPSRKGRGLAIAIIAIVVLVLAAVVVWMKTRTEETPNVAAPPVAAAAVPPPAIATAPGHLGINAFPWANVTSIRNVDRNENVEIGALVTPAPIDLPPGRYEVTLANPNFPAPIARTVTVAAGRDATLTVQFADPASATLPDFGVAR
jgi:eukaryotic-like serine/threonine-protein kinase